MDNPQNPAIFVGDARGLDFLNSVATPVDREVDWIGDGEGLLAWLDQAELVPRSVIESMREARSRDELDALAGQAREVPGGEIEQSRLRSGQLVEILQGMAKLDRPAEFAKMRCQRLADRLRAPARQRPAGHMSARAE